MNPRIEQELRLIPTGDIAQNTYRAAYGQARLTAFGTHTEVRPLPADANAVALEAARTQHAGFTPTILN